MLKTDPNSQTDVNWRIMIVEDDERLSALTKDYLESNGMKVSVEGDGSRAIERIKSEQPDLVVLDLMLPGEDGLAVCRLVRPYYKGPILMLTARIPPSRITDKKPPSSALTNLPGVIGEAALISERTTLPTVSFIASGDASRVR